MSVEAPKTSPLKETLKFLDSELMQLLRNCLPVRSADELADLRSREEPLRRDIDEVRRLIESGASDSLLPSE